LLVGCTTSRSGLRNLAWRFDQTGRPIGSRRDTYFDRCIRSEMVAVRSMTLGVPVADTAPDFVEKVKAARLCQVSEIANEVCDHILVACAAMLLERS
jgi:hypothetical protein